MPAPLCRRLALLTGLAGLFVFLADLFTGAPIRAGGWAGAPLFALRSLTDGLLPVLPVVAGVCASTLLPGARTVQHALRLVLAVTTVMLVLLAVRVRESGPAHPQPDNVAVSFNSGNQQRPVSVARADPERLLAMQRVRSGALLLLPIVVVGVMIGLTTWMQLNVAFRTHHAAALVRHAIGWLVSAGVCAIIVTWSAGYGYDILFRGRSAVMVCIPYLPALLLSLVGWRAAHRYRLAPADSWASRTHDA